MKKYLCFIFAITMIFTLFFTGCNPKKEIEESTTIFVTTEPTTVNSSKTTNSDIRDNISNVIEDITNAAGEIITGFSEAGKDLIDAAKER